MTVDSLLTWLMVFLRAVGVVLLLPTVAGRGPPVMARLGIAMGMATLVSGLVPPAHISYDLASLVLASGGEVLLGLALGFVAQMAFSAFAVVIFFLSGGHLAVITAFARSFMLAPAAHPALAGSASEALIAATARVIELGVRLAAPFIALNFLITLAFSVLGRAVPRLSVFILSAPFRGLIGLGVLSGAGALIARYLYGEFSELPMKLLQLLPPR
jgi:flagellar biosynthetic protein FliR